MPGEERKGGLLGWATFLGMLAALACAFVYAPTDVNLGETQRLFYIHVAVAWNGILALAVVFVASIAYLRTGRLTWDRLALASTEIGVLFVTMTLVTGSFWARFAWGIWWEWEPRLTSAFVLWFLYVATLLVRDLAEDQTRKGRYAAVFAIAAFADVPIVFLSVCWWRSYHPLVFRGGGWQLAPAMVVAMVVNVVAFTLLYAFLLERRHRLLALQGEWASCRRLLQEGQEETEAAQAANGGTGGKRR